MKIKEYFFKLLVLFGFMVNTGSANAQCSSNFTYFLGPNGQVTFSSAATPVNSTSAYSWDFGNSLTSQGTGSTLASPTINYTTNGTYAVVLTYSNSAPPCAASSSTQVININNVTCSISANFNPVPGPAGTYSFINTTLWATPATTYTWSYGDGAETYATLGVHTYSSNGNYNVKLLARNSGTANCIDTNITNINVITVPPCNLTVAYMAILSSSTLGLITFSNLSTGATASTNYTLKFGDGGLTNGVNFSTPITHTYTVNGSYTSKLTLRNSPTCKDSTTKITQVNNLPCGLNPNFTHTVSPPGFVSFNGTSANNAGPAGYYWDFGDGIYSTLQSPTHTYLFAGAYDVKLKVKDTLTQCQDSVIYAINITGLPCTANAGFNLSPSNAPQYWDAVPLFPWNVSLARWDWGDGTFSDSLYTSHTYPAAGTYSICLSVTVSCGATASVCSPYPVYKPSNTQQDMAVVHVNVKKPSLTNAIASFAGNIETVSIYPNPSNGVFNLLVTGLTTEVNIQIYNLVGELVYATKSPAASGEPVAIQPGPISNGIYFVNVRSGDQLFTKKIIVSQQ